MRVDVYFTPAELAGVELPTRVAVIDVIRATSTIVEALSNGARTIFPVATADDAARIAQNVGRDSVLLCGERKGLPIEGFDLGNAPPEFTPDRVDGKALVMTTTNGTRAFLAVAERQVGAGDGGSAIVAASLLNLTAVVERFAADNVDCAIVCAGREGRFAVEDAVCAGAIVDGLAAQDVALELNDAAEASRTLAGGKKSLERVLAESAAGRRLEEIGRGEDLKFCAQLDRTQVLPRLRDRKITLE